MKHIPFRLALFTSLAVLTLTFAVAIAQDAPPSQLDIVAVGNAYELSTTRLAAGWTTVSLDNRSGVEHFAVLSRMPAGWSLADSRDDVVPVFQDAMDLILDGRADEGFARLGDLPAWFGEATYVGGPGMVSGGEATEVVLRLEPGSYLIECYVKDANGVFHSTMGMVAELTVTDDAHDASPPTPTKVVTIVDPEPEANDLGASGYVWDGAFLAGPQWIEVRFDAEEPPLLGNDLHLARLDDGAEVRNVAAWMDWSGTTGLTTPAPVTFVGGTHEAPRGSSVFVRADLEPGRYAFVSERPADAPMIRTFEVR